MREEKAGYSANFQEWRVAAQSNAPPNRHRQAQPVPSTFAVQRCRLTVRRRMTATSEVAFVQDAQELNS